MIIAQRLVRRLCPHCISSYEADPSQIDIIKYMLKDLGIEALADKKDGFKLYKSVGCNECGMTGYKGRIGIYEVMNFSEDIRTLIRNGASPKEIVTAARK